MQKNDDDGLLLRKADDEIELSFRYGKPAFLGFLNEHESRLLKDNLKADFISFYGGHENAVRLMMGVNAEKDDYPISVLKFSYREEDALAHKDFLGALMGLGLNRNVIGDILVNKKEAYVFVKSENADFIIQQTDKIGRCGVKISFAQTDEITFEERSETSILTLSSLRLDVFISAVCNLSREKASRLIKAEMVSVNHYITDNNSKLLNEGDTVTARKYGKFVFEKTLGFSRKGKYKVKIKHYK